MIRKENDKKEFLQITKEKLHDLWKEIDDTNIIPVAAVSLYFFQLEKIMNFINVKTLNAYLCISVKIPDNNQGDQFKVFSFTVASKKRGHAI